MEVFFVDLFLCARECVCFIYFVVHRLVAATKSERRKRARFLFIAAPAVPNTLVNTHTLTHTCCCRLRLRRLSQRWQRHVKMRQNSFHKQLFLTFSFKFRYFSCLLRSATTITNSNNNYNLCSSACNDNALDV